MALGSGAVLATGRVVIRADTNDLKRGLIRAAHDFRGAVSNMEGHSNRFSGTLGLLGRTALLAGGTAGLGGFVLALKGGLEEMKKSEQVTAQTNQALRTTGGVANVTAKHIDDLANALLRKTGVDDEAIRTSENLLLAFTNVRNEAGKGNDVFDRTTKVIQDYAARTGKDAVTATVIFGKAMQDPTKYLGALARAGVVFDEGTKKQIKTLQASGDQLGAQKLLLQELEKRYKGAAEAAGDTLAGKLSILHETTKNLEASLVQGLAPALTAVVTKLGEWVNWLQTSQGFHDAVRSGIDGIRLVFHKTVEIVKALIPAFKGFWDVIKEVGKAVGTIAKSIFDGFKNVFSVFSSDGGDPGHSKSTMKQVHDAAKKIGDVLHDYVVPAIKLWADVMGRVIKVAAAVVKVEVKIIVAVIRTIITIVEDTIKTVRGIVGAFTDAFRAVRKAIQSFLSYLGDLPGEAGRKGSAIGLGVVHGVVRGLKALVSSVKAGFGALWSAVEGIANTATGYFFKIGAAIIEGIINGLGSLAGAVKDKLLGIVQGAFAHTAGWLKRKSPSRRSYDEIGVPLGQGIILGVEDALTPLGRVIVDKLTKAHSEAKTFVDSAAGNPSRGLEAIFAPGADRPGAHTGRRARGFANALSQATGSPVTVGTGTNHSMMTSSGNVSEHWSGNAIDIPATGARLIYLGRTALILAGMNPAEANRSNGGLYNINGYQIIFGINWGTRSGGDHTNHLHVGVSRASSDVPPGLTSFFDPRTGDPKSSATGPSRSKPGGGGGGGGSTSTFSDPQVNEDKVLVGTIDRFLRAQGSPMAGEGVSFVAAGRKYGIDSRYLVALAGAESSFGLHCFLPFNPFGWGSVTFGSWREAIFTVAAGLKKGYTSQGRTSVESIAKKYAPVGASNDPHGTNAQEPVNVSTFLRRLGGDPGNVGFATSTAPRTRTPVAPTYGAGELGGGKVGSAPTNRAEARARARVTGLGAVTGLVGVLRRETELEEGVAVVSVSAGEGLGKATRHVKFTATVAQWRKQLAALRKQLRKELHNRAALLASRARAMRTPKRLRDPGLIPLINRQLAKLAKEIAALRDAIGRALDAIAELKQQAKENGEEIGAGEETAPTEGETPGLIPGAEQAPADAVPAVDSGGGGGGGGDISGGSEPTTTGYSQEDVTRMINEALVRNREATLGYRQKFLSQFAPNIFHREGSGLAWGSQPWNATPTPAPVVINNHFEYPPDDHNAWMARNAFQARSGAMG